MKTKKFIFNSEKNSLKDFESNYTDGYKDKDDAKNDLEKGVETLSKLQDKLYAHDKYSVLIIFQAMDAAGKDGTIKHVMSGVNPQGCEVSSFKSPSTEELDHDYLWRCIKQLPGRGKIGIFNRSYYEEVLVTKVHPEFLDKQKLPNLEINKKFWKKRYEDINYFEEYLTNNGTIIIKFFLNVSKDEQKKRFLDRINDPTKNWKFSSSDLKERKMWDNYMDCYDDMFKQTSTKHAPWYIVPADNKWFMRNVVSKIINERLKSLKLEYPNISDEQKLDLEKAKEILLNE